ncbi:MAG: hypothetical protein LLG04_03960, partial [Parachlamydia sp.]|nr:hypothetical protein [Parachlamydia sp.]
MDVSSLFVRPPKIKETREERRLWLLKERAELGEALGRLGIQDPLLGIKRELEQVLTHLVAERTLSAELQELSERIKPLGAIYFPKKDDKHISEMLASIKEASKHLPSKGTQKIASLLTKLQGFYLQEQRRDPATAGQFSCSLHGLTTGYLYLPPNVMDKLLPLNEKGGVVKSLQGMGTGTRAVNRHGNIFCKDKPEAPSYQFAWDTFLQVFCDDNTAASQFAHAHRKAGIDDKAYQTQTS